VRPTRVWKKLLGLRRAVVEAVDFDEEQGALVVSRCRGRGTKDATPSSSSPTTRTP